MFEKFENTAKADSTSHLKVDLASSEQSSLASQMKTSIHDTASNVVPGLQLVDSKIGSQSKKFAMNDEEEEQELELPSTGTKRDNKRFPLGPGEGYDHDKGYEPLDGNLRFPSGRGDGDPYA